MSAGDLCDIDLDGDGVLNTIDTCVYLSNPAQNDTDGDGIGDDCETDADGDGVIDKNDTCPYNPSIWQTSFKKYFTVELYPGLNTTSPFWMIKDNEGEVMQTKSTGMPVMLIGKFLLSFFFLSFLSFFSFFFLSFLLSFYHFCSLSHLTITNRKTNFAR